MSEQSPNTPAVACTPTLFCSTMWLLEGDQRAAGHSQMQGSVRQGTPRAPPKASREVDPRPEDFLGLAFEAQK